MTIRTQELAAETGRVRHLSDGSELLSLSARFVTCLAGGSDEASDSPTTALVTRIVSIPSIAE